jgi:hypothetical protein
VIANALRLRSIDLTGDPTGGDGTPAHETA